MEDCYKFFASAPAGSTIVTHSKVIRALKAIHDNGGKWNDKAAEQFLASKIDADFDYNVGTIGGYVDPGIDDKKKKKLKKN